MHELDFWLGSWVCTWEGGAGSNTVSRELGGPVIVERFEIADPTPFSGMSVSVYDARTGGWRQTWVDSTGSYWHFAGGRQPDGSFVFATPAPVDAEHVFKRMTFFDLAPDAFRWRWESSPDRVEWKELWAIAYQRRPTAG
jgi:hypothetical protein